MSSRVLYIRSARITDISKRFARQKKHVLTLLGTSVSDAEHEALSLLKEYSTQDYPAATASIQILLGKIYFALGRPSDALTQFSLAREWAEQNGDEPLYVEALAGEGIVLKELGDAKNAVLKGLSALTIQNELDPRDWCVDVFKLLIHSYVQLSDFKTALQYAEQGRIWAQNFHLLEQEATILIGFSIIYAQLKEPKKALSFERASLQIHEQLKIDRACAANCINIGSLYSRQKDFHSALEWDLKALKLHQKTGDKRNEVLSFAHLASMYLELGDLAQAKFYAEETVTIARERGNKIFYMYALAGLGEYYHRIGDYPKAKAPFEEALSIFETSERIELRINILQLLIEIYENENNYETALRYQKELANAEVFFKQEQNHRLIVQLQTGIDVELIKQEREQYRVQAMQAITAFEQKAQELAELSTRVSERRKVLHTLSHNLANLQNDFSDKELLRIRSEVHRELREENQASNVDSIVAQLEPVFLSTLSTKYPELSNSEKKICLLLKLNLRTPEIANLLSASERTIENHRLHIRKKMQLPPKISLSEHLNNLETSLH